VLSKIVKEAILKGRKKRGGVSPDAPSFDVPRGKPSAPGFRRVPKTSMTRA
jgi:hypothetical protein